MQRGYRKSKKVIPKTVKPNKVTPKKVIMRAIQKKARVLDTEYESEESDATKSDDSDYEPDSASDEDDDPHFPKHLADMGEGVIIPVHANKANTWFKKDGNVIELDEEHIKSIGDMAIVMFFAEWCPHCQHMKPVFESVAETSPIQCYAVDCESHPTLSNTYNIEGFPTIMALKNGLAPPFMVKDDSYIYPGGPNKESLTNWINESKTKLKHEPTKTSKPISSELKSAHLKGIKQFMGVEAGDLFNGSKVHVLDPDSLDITIKENKPFLIMFFAPWCGHCIHAKDMYKALAEKMDVYAMNADEYGEKAESYGVSGFPTFGMMANGHLQKYTGARTEEGLMEFSKTFSNSESKIVTITSLDDLRKMDQVITMFYAPWCGHCTHFKPTFADLAKEHSISFAMVNCDELPDAKSEFGIRGFPTIHKLGMGKILSTFSDSPRTAETVSNWIKHS